MSAPIPRRLLPHSARLDRYTGTGKSGPVYGESVDLEHVRFEAVKQNAMSNLGDAKADRFTLFIDMKNTSPQGIIPSIKDRVVFRGEGLIVRTVQILFGSTVEAHHCEARLA